MQLGRTTRKKLMCSVPLSKVCNVLKIIVIIAFFFQKLDLVVVFFIFTLFTFYFG